MPAFYESTNKTGIVDDAYFQIGADTSSYPLGNVTFHANIGYAEVISAILRADGRWRYDDNNIGEALKTTFNLSNGISEYGLLSATPVETYQDFSKIFGIAVCDENGDNWQDLDFNTKEKVMETGIAWDEYKSVDGKPDEYFLEGTQFFLKPAPSYDYTNGGVLFLQRNPEFFAYTDTTKVPGFDQKYHYIISLFIQRGFFMANNPSKVPNIQALIDRGLRNVMIDYAGRAAGKLKEDFIYPNWK